MRAKTYAHPAGRDARNEYLELLKVPAAALAAEVVCVLLGKVGPLLGQVVGGKNGRDRAGRDARTAVDALDRVNEQLIGFAEAGFVLLGVDAIDRTGVYTGGVLGADTGFCNDVCHL